MIIKDEGYILNSIKYGEKSLIVTILSASKGKITGYVSDGNSKKNRGIFQIGNKIFYEASGRLEENMKRLFRVELISPNAVNMMQDIKKLELMSASVPMFIKLLNENEEVLLFYDIIGKFFTSKTLKEMFYHYALFEFYVLEYLGVGLMLDCCAVTGQTQDLYYVSPKTGKAVSKQIRAPYHDRLFKYPQFVVDKSDTPTYKEIFNVLEMTSYFLKENFFKFHNLKMPDSHHKITEILATLEDES